MKEEKHGFRDERISRRHRIWGVDCPAVDIDFLLIEYDTGVPKALVEYKHENAAPQKASHPSYRALIWLANKGMIPIFCTRYNDEMNKFMVMPLNEFAKEYIPLRSEMTEIEWVRLIYKMRGKDIPEDVLRHLKLLE